ncbi:response regulator [Massilia sp. TS11]|uniref:response regulator n=1 Tax=Massilia sp. TS11 TaxID=2908003 RepID=UPI001ED9F7F0|nr:response regulator [Massilia sp. TS11]MCG2586476.1 response regulator [Massilia sp. TS11]
MDKSANILIVDDYLLIRTAVRGVLGELGFFNVFQADNGKSAQELMRKQPVDIVIADWSMPVMNGLELLKWMRRDERHRKTPFMMLTAEANPSGVQAAMKAGVNAYLVKPFTVHSFASKFLGMLGPVADAPRPPETGADQLAREQRLTQVAPSVPTAAPTAAPSAPPPRLPEAAPPLPAPAVIGLERPIAERLKKCTVLIVDDIATNIEVLAGALKDDYALKVAISGRKAIEIANQFHIDLILLDIMMPVMDGYEVCRQLKANARTANIPVIFLSARDGVEDVVAGLKLGAVDYVTKPVDPTILKARLSAHLTLSTAMRDLQRQNDVLAESAQLREDVDRMTRHDLKSPVGVALQCAESLLADPRLPADLRDKVELVASAAGHALEMVNRTLDVVKMEMGQYQPVLAQFGLGPLLRKVAQQTEAAFAWKEIRCRLEDGIDSDALGEELLCYSMFSNLFKNAAEASPQGGIIVVSVAPGFGNAHICIDNEGEVPNELRERFFDKYATMGKAGGTGLGTYSVKLMAEVQGGEVAMQSEDGRTRLTVTLPAP